MGSARTEKTDNACLAFGDVGWVIILLLDWGSGGYGSDTVGLNCFECI
jgi:hypothetical protein